MTEFVPVTDQRHSQAQPCQRSEKPDNCPLAKENPNNLADIGPEGLHNSNFTPLLDRHGDQRAHDPKRRHDDDKEQQEKHHRALEPNRFEILAIHVDPRLRVFWRLEKLLDLLFHALGPIRVVSLHGDAVQRVFQTI